MTNRERAAKAIRTTYAYQWFEGQAPELSELESAESGREELTTSVADLLTDLQHWAKFNDVDFDELLERAKWMFVEEDSANCRACNENNEALEHTCY
jgi:hypothetical protein